MKNSDSYQYQLGMYDRIPTSPYLRPSIVPSSPTKHDYWSGILMNGVFAYKPSYLSYYQTQTQIFDNPFRFRTFVPNTDVYTGIAPVRGVITGVKNGR